MNLDKKIIIMAKSIARVWLESQLKENFRLRIYNPFPLKFRKFYNILQLYRNGKFTFKNVPLIPDLGIKREFDYICIWTSDYEKLNLLNGWLETNGFETSGII